jgi:hypothetical protein
MMCMYLFVCLLMHTCQLTSLSHLSTSCSGQQETLALKDSPAYKAVFGMSAGLCFTLFDGLLTCIQVLTQNLNLSLMTKFIT